MPAQPYPRLMSPRYGQKPRSSPRQPTKPRKPADMTEIFTDKAWLTKKQQKDLHAALIVGKGSFEQALTTHVTDPEVLKFLRSAGKKQLNAALMQYVRDPATDCKKMLSELPAQVKLQLRTNLETKPFGEAISATISLPEESKKLLNSLGKTWAVETGFGGDLTLFNAGKASAKRAREETVDTPVGESPQKVMKINEFNNLSGKKKLALKNLMERMTFAEAVASLALEKQQAEALSSIGFPAVKMAIKAHFGENVSFYNIHTPLLAQIPAKLKLKLKANLETMKFKEAIEAVDELDAPIRAQLQRAGKKVVMELLEAPVVANGASNGKPAASQAAKESFASLTDEQKASLRTALETIAGFKSAIDSLGASFPAMPLLQAGKVVVHSLVAEHFKLERLERPVSNDRPARTSAREAFDALQPDQKSTLREALEEVNGYKKALDSLGADFPGVEALSKLSREEMKKLLSEHYSGEEIEFASFNGQIMKVFKNLSDALKQELYDSLRRLPFKIAIEAFLNRLSEEPKSELKKLRPKPHHVYASLKEHFKLEKLEIEPENTLRERLVEEARTTLEPDTMHAIRQKMQKMPFTAAIQDAVDDPALAVTLMGIGERRLKSMLEAELGEVVLGLNDVMSIKFARLPDNPPREKNIMSKSEFKTAFLEKPFHAACDSLQIPEQDKDFIRMAGFFEVKRVLENYSATPTPMRSVKEMQCVQ